MKTRFVHLWLPLCLLFSILIFSCKRDIENIFSPTGIEQAANLENAKIFYAKGATLNPKTYSDLMNMGGKTTLADTKSSKRWAFYKIGPLWKDAFEIKAYDGEQLIAVPTKENGLKEKSIQIRRFFIFTIKGGMVADGKIVEFLGSNYSLNDKINQLIANYKNSKISDLTGAIFTYDLNYFQLSGERYVNGNPTGERSVLKNLDKASTSGNVKTLDYCSSCDPNTCYELYWCWYTNGRLDECNFTGYSDGCYSSPWPTSPGSGSGYDSSSGYTGGGGGSGPYGGNSAVSINIAFNGPKINPTTELKCFDSSQPATLTIYVQQPNENTRDMMGSNSVGHAFVGITQNGITRTIGFYPDSPMAAVFSNQSSELHDNSGEMYHVSLTKSVSASQLNTVLTYIKGYPSTYSLSNYNCTDFAIAVAGKAGLTLPATTGSYTAGLTYTGRNPGDLGQDIRSMALPAGTTRSTSQHNAPVKAGNCP